MTSDSSRRAAVEHMLSRQLTARGIRDPRVLAAMARVPRERFVPADEQALSYADRALPIACGQTISQPYIVALMTEALALRGGERVLEIGTGSGYQTAVLAEIAGEVVSVERHAELSAEADARLRECGYRNVELHVGDGAFGWPARAPYDGILVTAATQRCPEPLLEQLAEGGSLIVPLGGDDGQMLTLLKKTPAGVEATELTECRFVPLVQGA